MNSQVSEEALAAFKKHFMHIHLMLMARRLWDRVLRLDDRAKLGENFEAAINRHKTTIGMWRVLHPGVSEEQAVLDISKSMSTMDEATYNWLMREMVSDPQRIRGERPDWNRDCGILTFRGEVIRRVRVGTGTHIVRILDEFEAQGWPDRIDSPITKTRDDQVHRDSIRKLNARLSAIRFRSDGTGTGILWEPDSKSTV